MVQRKPKRVITAKISHGNPKTKIMIDKNCKSKGQILDFSKGRCLNRFYNSNNGLKMEFV